MSSDIRRLYEIKDLASIHYRVIAHRLAKYVVDEAYGIGDSKEADDLITKLGYESGLSEDTYYEMNPYDDDDDGE